jgi:GMP synthase-like glutamine amidotransferase
VRLHYIQHVPPENPGSILLWANEKGHSVSHTIIYENERFPGLQSFDWLVVMGGPMNIYEEEEHPWLAEEKDFIKSSIAAGKVVLGFCLGGQLIADVIGGKVTVNVHPEIGWFPIQWSERARADTLFSFFPENPVVFHWHSDTFSVLPPEAEVLAKSIACSHQAFVFRERVFGFQFHLENTAEMLQGLIALSGGELMPAAYVQSPEEMMGHPEHISQNNRWLAEFLTRLEQRERRCFE